MWVGTLEFSARGHEIFLPTSYRFTHPFKPPQVTSELFSLTADPENCSSLVSHFFPSISGEKSGKEHRLCNFVTLHGCHSIDLICLHNLFFTRLSVEMVALFERLDVVIKTLQSHLLYVSAGWKNAEVLIIKDWTYASQRSSCVSHIWAGNFIKMFGWPVFQLCWKYGQTCARHPQLLSSDLKAR